MKLILITTIGFISNKQKNRVERSNFTEGRQHDRINQITTKKAQAESPVVGYRIRYAESIAKLQA